MDKFDVLIIGGGTAGATAAFILASAGLTCLIADDASQFKSYKIGESLLGAAKPILQQIGLMPWVAQSLPQNNIGNLSAWGSERLVSTDFIFSPHGSGWHLDRALFDQSLRQAAEHVGAIFHNGYIKKVYKSGDGWVVNSKHRAIQASWIVDASGRYAFMSKHLNILRYEDKPLIAMYSWGKNTAKETRTLVESAPYGWWYTASLPNQKRVAALHMRPTDMKSLLQKNTDWGTLIGSTKFVSQICVPDESWTRPQGADAAGQWQQKICGENWIAIGDAALAFEPLSSQGIFNAIYTAWKASKLVISFFNNSVTEYNSYKIEINNIRSVYIKTINDYYKIENRWNKYNFWLN